MTIRDIKNNIDSAATLDPATRATGTLNGTGVDLQGYNAAMLVVHFGSYTNGTHTPSLEHSDDNVSFSAVGAAELEGSFTPVNASAASTTQRVGYKGSKRYVRGVMVVTSGATGCASSAMVIRGQASALPV